jgi:ribonuclease R
VDIRVVEHNIAHEVIEEFMLAANEAVAEWLHGKLSPSLYRIHEDPDPAGIDEVEESLQTMGFNLKKTHGATSARIRTLLASFRGRPEEPAVAMRILRSLKLARYSHEPVGHFGLAAPLYTHFTSPIRRYPDLVVHRILRTTRKKGWRPPAGGADPGERLARVATECSRLERRAEEAERAMVDWKKAVYMKERIGQEYQGMVTGVTAGFVFVTLDGIGVEGMVPLSAAEVERGRAAKSWRTRTAASKSRLPASGARRRDSGGRQSAPRWSLGDRVRVRVQAVDTFRARILLKPLSMG